MIKYNNSNINDWYFVDDNIIKVYRNNAVCYYKIVTSGGTTAQTPCFAVVENISQYSDTEFEDVFNNADSKWYKLNNLNQYEVYGVYGSGRTITYYEGKLTVDDGYEYMYSGSSWVNVGEISGDTKTSGFTSSDIGDRITSMVSDGDYIMISYYNKNSTSDPTMIMSYQNTSPYYVSNLSGYGITSIDSSTVLDAAIWKLEATATADTFYVQNVNNNMYWGYQSRVSTSSFNLVDSTNKCPVQFVLPACKDNCFGFVEKKSNSSTVYGGYGLNQLNARTYQLNWWDNGSGLNCDYFGTDGNSDFILYKLTGTKTIYPLNYDVIQSPPNNLTFSSMTEAEEYECPWVGMNATIDGVKYIFSGDSISGYEWVYNPSRLPDGYTEVEYIENTGTSYINTDLQIYSSTTNSFEVEGKLIAAKHDSSIFQNVFSCMSEDGEPYQGFAYRYQSSSLGGTSMPNGQNTFTIVNNADSTQTVTVTSSTSQRTYTHTYPLTLFCGLNSSRNPFRWTNSKFYYFKIKINDELVRDLVPAKRDSDSVYGVYDLINDVFYTSPNGNNFIGGEPVI